MEVEKNSLSVLVATSLAGFLMENMFIRREFDEQREYAINRNWVLHGRDDPKYWTKADALKLINLLSTIQFIKD